MDGTPQNPDELILQCANPECKQWLHVKCIAETAAQSANEGSGKKSAGAKRRKAKDPDVVVTPPAQAAARAGSYLAEVYVEGLPDGPDDTPETKSRIVISNDDEDGKREEDLRCLFCDTAIA